MNEFVGWQDWFTQKYRHLIGEGVRYPSMKMALNLLHQRGGKVIVETGTTRAENDFGGAGMATIFFGEYCQRYGKELWTVDILPEAISLSKELTLEFKDVIHYVIDDSLNFLKSFDKNIDLLYLDSFDYPLDENPDEVRASQEHQLNELKTAFGKLNSESIIILDDNGWKEGGKCKLSKEFLIENGWECLWDDFQSVWQKYYI